MKQFLNSQTLADIQDDGRTSIYLKRLHGCVHILVQDGREYQFISGRDLTLALEWLDALRRRDDALRVNVDLLCAEAL